jgi:integral membrane protein (TIGR01906 family)
VLALTGYSGSQLDGVDGALLSDLLLWQGDFRVTVDGQPVLNERERAHMLDVRGVFSGFGILVLGSAAIVVGALVASRATPSRAMTWRAIGGGARGLAVGVAVAGAFSIVAFDAVFELFHELFFPAGSYTFDPATDRLVQLFPDQFWSETTIAVGVVALVLAAVAWAVAGNRSNRAGVAPGWAPWQA